MSRITTNFFVKVLVALLVGLAVTVVGLSLWLRRGLQRQILQREGVSLHAVTTMQRAIERERLDELGLSDRDQEFALLALQVTRLEGVLDVQVYGLDGESLADSFFSVGITKPTEEEWNRLRANRPLVRLLRLTGEEAKLSATGKTVMLDVLVPLHDEADQVVLSGAARFLMDGTAVEREFARVDSQLWLQGLIVWLVAGGLLGGVTWMALRRLRHAQGEIEARTRELAQSNRELAFAAKTSALGAVTAHLVHGLRNPIAGLEQLMSSEPGASDRSEGIATARRMRDMVNEVVTLMHEEKSGSVYEVPVKELLDDVVARVASLAKERGARLTVEAAPDLPALSNREAGLAAAILTNLARNACEAIRSGGGDVRLRAGLVGANLEISVIDNGPGIAPEVAASLFEPTRSTKPGGAGIGLAICRQLAVHLGATLDYKTAITGGAHFTLILPQTV